MVMFGLSSVVVATAVGAGIDLSRTFFARQELAATASLACQYANRSSIVSLVSGAGGSSSYVSNVTSFVNSAFASQQTTWSQTTPNPFSYTAGSTSGTVSLTASVPTMLMRIVGITNIPVSATEPCPITLSSNQESATGGAGTPVVSEGFENTAAPSSFAWYTPTGQIYTPTGGGSYSLSALNTPPTVAGYTGTTGTEWLIMGYCLEVDAVGQILSDVAQGSHSAELDCDNGHGSAGNSSISTKTYLAAGTYELRWDYAARIPNYYYGTSYICGSTASDTSWANDGSYENGFTGHARTNQINVYLDQDSTGTLPTHSTLDGTQTLGGANLVDECVYSSGWIERSVKITIATPGSYWLSFAADGANDSFGGQLDNIRLCTTACAGTAWDDFPSSWLSASNGGNDVTLFEDTFESPSYSGSPVNLTGNVGLSYGSSYSWDEEGQGWGNAPTNQIPYWTSGCPQGNQCVQLGAGSNSLIGKPFLLDPGYYQVSYNYVSEVTFAGLTGSYCGATPTAANVSALTGVSGAGTMRVTGLALGTVQHDTNMVGVFMSHAQEASTPNPSSTLGSITSYTNPDGTTSTTPTVPPNAISLTNYNSAQVNPLLDICGYAATAQTRTRTVYIQKPALYWLTLAALGTTDAYGGVIDDVKITALGSPYMASPPSNYVTIPVPNPQVGTSLSYPGFSVVVQP